MKKNEISKIKRSQKEDDWHEHEWHENTKSSERRKEDKKCAQTFRHGERKKVMR